MSYVITQWQPEDAAFWQTKGRSIATRNLWISIPCLLLAFAIWMVWSVVTVQLNRVGFNFTTDQLFWLTALPGLSGATFRIFYSFMVPIFGGRKWTTISTASLLIPCIWMGFAVQDTETPYSVFVIIALLCGFGGGNFASSMANISFFYPKSQQGTALGMNAGLGNLGVSIMQFILPLAITGALFGVLGGEGKTLSNGDVLFLQNAGFIWVPFLLIFTAAAWFGMNDLAEAKASFKDQAVIFRRKHQWLMSWLYTATFGSFIGFAAGFPLLVKTQFPEVDALKFAFLGPLVGALLRPVGGWMADKLGGARVTLWNFYLMIAGVFGVLYFLPSGGGNNFYGLLAMFILLFVATGLGNGSTFRMIPVIFRTEWERRVDGDPNQFEFARKEAGKESAAALGFSSAIAAYGGFFIPKAFGSSIAMTGAPDAALYGFMAFYVTCILATWYWYARKNAEVPC